MGRKEPNAPSKVRHEKRTGGARGGGSERSRHQWGSQNGEEGKGANHRRGEGGKMTNAMDTADREQVEKGGKGRKRTKKR